MVVDGSVREDSDLEFFRWCPDFPSCVENVRHLYLHVEWDRRSLTATVLLLEARRVLCFRNLHAKAFQVARGVWLHRVGPFGGAVDVFGVFLYFAAYSRGCVRTGGHVQRSFLGFTCLKDGRYDVVSASRRFRRVVTSQLREGVGVQRRYA